MTESALYTGRVMHRRLRPKLHQLGYRLFSLLIDLDEAEALDRRLRLFSWDRFNLLSIRPGDYGDGSGRPLREQVSDDVARLGLEPPARIALLTLPRILGFVFNPLSLFYCYDSSGQLTAVVHEVHNTFGERHRYVLLAAPGDAVVRQDAPKHFHVSPFLPMDLHYDFRLKPPGADLQVAITVSDREGPLLVAVQRMRRYALSDGALLKAVASMPLMTMKVVAGILWDASKLWVKGVAVHRHPGLRADQATYGTPVPIEDRKAA